MPTTQATRARLRIGRCYPGQVLEVAAHRPASGLAARHRLRVGGTGQGARAAAELLNEATRSQPSCDVGVSVRVVPCTAGMPVGDRYEGGAVQASVRVVETLDVPTTGAASCSDVRAQPTAGPAAGRRVPQRAIEIVGIVLGIAFIASVARAHDLSNDEFWSLAAGQWMLAHHAFMGLDPFSYTESHRRWVTDEWGSEVALAGLFRAFGSAAYSLYAIVLGGLCLVASAAYARALGARGGRVAAIVLLLAIGIAGVVAGDRGLDFSLGLAAARTAHPDQGAGQPALVVPPAPLLCLVWVNTHGSILLGLLVLGVELGWSLVPERFVGRIGGRAPVDAHRAARARVGGQPRRLVHHALRARPAGLRHRRLAERPDRAVHRRVELTQLPFGDDAARLLRPAGRAGGRACGCAASRCSRAPLASSSSSRRCRPSDSRSTSWWSPPAWPRPSRRGRPWGTTARRWAGAGLMVVAIVVLAIPAVPAGTVASSQPVRAFDYLSAHPGRIFTEYTWGDYSVARHRATFVDGRTDLFEGTVLTEFIAVSNLTTEPGPRAVRLPRLLRGVGAPHPVGDVSRPRSTLARGRPVVGGVGLRVARTPATHRGQPNVASRPRRSPSSSDQVWTSP